MGIVTIAGCASLTFYCQCCQYAGKYTKEAIANERQLLSVINSNFPYLKSFTTTYCLLCQQKINYFAAITSWFLPTENSSNCLAAFTFLVDRKLLLCSVTSPRIALAILVEQNAGFALFQSDFQILLSLMIDLHAFRKLEVPEAR